MSAQKIAHYSIYFHFFMYEYIYNLRLLIRLEECVVLHIKVGGMCGSTHHIRLEECVVLHIKVGGMCGSTHHIRLEECVVLHII